MTDGAAAAAPATDPGGAAIRAELRARLPAEAFAPNPSKLIEALAYLAVIAAGYAAIRTSRSVALNAIVAVVIGACHLSLGFIAHDLSHGSVVRGKRVRALLESVLWAINATPATVWLVNHNRTHHHNTNGRLDSFRYFGRSERTWLRTLFAVFFLPHRHLRWNPLVGLAYVLQIGTHTVAVLLGGGRREGAIGCISNLGRYSRKARVRLYFEVTGIVALQLLLFRLLGASGSGYLWGVLVPFLIASAGASCYLYSQHSLHPLVHVDDPFLSTSLRLPGWADRLHSFHSHHTAHHLFPGMRSDFYPAVTDALAREHPDRLHRLGVLECWQRIFDNDLYKADPT